MTDAVTRKWIRSAADEKAADAGCRFDLAAAERARGFLQRFTSHSKGKFAGKPFELLDWQWNDVIAPAYGWKRPDGTRRYRRVAVWVPKKNGKSTLCAGLILYGLVGDNEPGAEVYGAAADRNQAKIIFGEVAAMIDQSPALRKRLTVNKTISRVVYDEKRSFYQVLSKDSHKTGHGVNASLCVVDELHVVDRELYDTLRYAGAAREQPLMIEISTAGNDKTSLGYDRYCYAKRLLKGEIEDSETLAVIYEADPDGDWTDEEQWAKSNPSLGVTIRLDSFRSDFNEARNATPAVQANFKQLRLNLWQDATFAWLSLEQWDACAADITREQTKGYPCWGAFDLASKLDLCAWALIFRVEDEYRLFLRFWSPEGADERRAKENRAQLRGWIEEGWIKATEGDVTDYRVIEADILAEAQEYNPVDAAYDPWNATQIAVNLQEQFLQTFEFQQSMRQYNEPMKEFEKLVISGKLKHDGNPVMRWMIGHLVARKDPSGNIRPDKEHSADKIDGACAAIMALARATLQEPEHVPTIEFF